jgi:hypothetical protein
MEEHRRLGLCFNCNEKFGCSHNHVCQRIFLLDLAARDDDNDTTDLEEPASDSSHISLHVIAGVRTSETMQVHITLGGATLLVLLDSGSTHNFVSENATDCTFLQLLPKGNMKVTVANGKRIPCPGIYSATTFTVCDESFTVDFFALPLAGYDMVLGTQWQASLGSILWDFGTLTMSFWRHDHKVCWHGIAGLSSPPYGSAPAPTS